MSATRRSPRSATPGTVPRSRPRSRPCPGRARMRTASSLTSTVGSCERANQRGIESIPAPQDQLSVGVKSTDFEPDVGRAADRSDFAERHGTDMNYVVANATGGRMDLEFRVPRL